MSRRSPRYRARFAATVQIAGVEHTLVCHTRDISAEGCFLDTAEVIAEGVPVSLALMDNERGEAVQVDGLVARAMEYKGHRGIGVRLVAPPPSWGEMVARYRRRDGTDAPPPGTRKRLTILVVGDEAQRRGALALYVTSGWDVRFAADLETAREALTGVELDAVIAEHSIAKEREQVLEAAKELQPEAVRIARSELGGKLPTLSEDDDALIHQELDVAAGLDALVEALTGRAPSVPA